MVIARSFCVGAAVLLSACSTPNAEVAKPQDPVVGQLERSIRLVKTSEQEFSRSADSAGQPPEAVLAGNSLTVTYMGEAQVLIAALARAQGKEAVVLGKHPRLPLPVVVNAKDETLLSLARDIGSQFGQRADLVLTDKTIEIRYRDFNGK